MSQLANANLMRHHIYKEGERERRSSTAELEVEPKQSDRKKSITTASI